MESLKLNSAYAARRFDEAAAFLPRGMRLMTELIDPETKADAEEIRLRVGQPLGLTLGTGDRLCGRTVVTSRDMDTVLEIATGASVYAAEESIRRGYITVRGGHRIGICGTAVVKNGEICGIREMSSISIRIAREHKGIAREIYEELATRGRAESLIIIAPPGWGKTSFLRDLIRLVSDGGVLPSMRVAVADERGELAAALAGAPQLDLGVNSDVMTGAPKDRAVLMLLRTMNPQVIAVDEITAPEDVQALMKAANCGTLLLATAHAESVNDFIRRPVYEPLLENSVFKDAVTIRMENGKRAYGREKLC